MDIETIFKRIVDTTSSVFSIDASIILSSDKHDSVCDARSCAVFWLYWCGFYNDEILRFTDKDEKANECINKIKRRYERVWPINWKFRECVRETGLRLSDIAEKCGHPFDRNVPLEHMRKITGR